MKIKFAIVRILRICQKWMNRIRFKFITIKRNGYSIYQFDALAKDIPQSLFYTLDFEKNNSNLFYNHAGIIKEYAGFNKKIQLPFAIEHSPYLNNYVWDVDINTDTFGIITFSDYRCDVLSKATTKLVIPIGPYIHYAKSFLSIKEFEQEKKKLGKTLLVFPAHSTHFHGVSYDYQQDVNFLLKIGKDFDSILVCLYWKDIIAGKANNYRNSRFKIVTAGHIFDPHFLNRLKTIIQLSDFTMSNSPGNHIGYCVHLNKPHYLYLMDTTISTLSNISKHWEEIDISEWGNSRDLVVENFSRFQNFIDPEQKKVVEYIWGTNHIKTKEEMFDILNGKGMNG